MVINQIALVVPINATVGHSRTRNRCTAVSFEYVDKPLILKEVMIGVGVDFNQKLVNKISKCSDM